MTYRDPTPTTPDCPVCESADGVKRHDNPYQGRWLCHGCMLLFDGTSAEWARPSRERADAGDGVNRARAALRKGLGAQ